MSTGQQSLAVFPTSPASQLSSMGWVVLRTVTPFQHIHPWEPCLLLLHLRLSLPDVGCGLDSGLSVQLSLCVFVSSRCQQGREPVGDSHRPVLSPLQPWAAARAVCTVCFFSLRKGLGEASVCLLCAVGPVVQPAFKCLFFQLRYLLSGKWGVGSSPLSVLSGLHRI